MKPLRITKESAGTLFSHYNIGPGIYEVIFSFGDKPSNSDAGLGAMTVKHQRDGSYGKYQAKPQPPHPRTQIEEC
jgi:hypothetical protein